MNGKLTLMAGVLAAAMTTGAQAMIMDSAGNVTDWGITPFSLTNQSDRHVGNLWSTISNNYSPINYPGVGHQPSPGLSSGGEAFDLEEMHMRVTAEHLQVLVITSSALATQAVGNTWYLGDLFVTADRQQFAVVTQAAGRTLAPGAMYRVNGAADTVALQSASGSYLGYTTKVQNDYGPNATVADIAGPWEVKNSIDPAQLLGAATIRTATFNYGGSENGTFLVEYTIDKGLLDMDSPADLMAKIAWGCGNDVIRVHGVSVDTMPEPATLAMLILGSIATLVMRRRRTV